MLKIILQCDKCKKEIPPGTQIIFLGKKLEIRTSMPTKDLLAPFKLSRQKGPVFLEEILEFKFHLCSSCYMKFEEFLKQE